MQNQATRKKLAAMKTWLQAYSETYPTSIGLGVIHGGAWIDSYFGGSASLRFEVPISAVSKFPIASLTKSFTAALMLKMAEEHQIQLHQPVKKQLPEWDWLDERITPHHWLCHSSGMPDYPLPKGESLSKTFGHLMEDEAWINQFCSAPLTSKPGETYAYCNPGYWLLGRLMEEKGGASFEQLLQQNILEPCGIGIEVDDPSRIIPHRVEGYDWEEGGLIPAPFTDARNFIPQGGLLASVADMVNWVLALSGGNKILSKASMETMFHPHMISSPKRSISYGYGVHVLERFGQAAWGHSGSHWGYRSHMEYYPKEEFGLVLLSNHGFQETFGMADTLGKIWFGEEVPLPKKADPWSGKHSAIQPFLGTYQKGDYEATFFVDQDQYFLQLPHGRQWIYPTKPGEFAHTFLDESFAIKKTESGMEFWGLKKR